MDYLQYYSADIRQETDSFVLNLIIDGLPSIQFISFFTFMNSIKSFKPYYRWITFNTISIKIFLTNLIF